MHRCRLLTPAPQYHGQIGRCGRQLFRADFVSATGRLGWRHVPWWHLWDHLHHLLRQPKIIELGRW